MAKATTIRNGTLGKRVLRLVEQDGKYFGLADGIICVQGTEIDKVWETLHREAGKSDPKYFGYKGALARFQKFFPNGFHSDGFNSQERAYKLAAKEKLEALAPLSDTLEGSGFGEAILSVYRSTNMLSPFEKTKLQDVLRGKDSDAIVQAVAKFTVKKIHLPFRTWLRNSSHTTVPSGQSSPISHFFGNQRRICF
ncbi:hypothetical protein WNY37_18420 [Henriciella sp. AS95]|uniref:hypothetical protein n=1 Tax=Henriciella sp. AS95 TaxID=3135782 RepID=UPI00317208AD